MNLSMKKLLAVINCLFIYGASTEYAKAENCEPQILIAELSYSVAMSTIMKIDICSVLDMYVQYYNFRDNFCIEIQDPDVSESFFVEIDVSCKIVDDGKRNETFTRDQDEGDSGSQPATNLEVL